jgi:hypothetical protein
MRGDGTSEGSEVIASFENPRWPGGRVATKALDYIEALKAATPTQGRTDIDQDTSMSPGSFEAALRSAGGAIVRFSPSGSSPRRRRSPRG